MARSVLLYRVAALTVSLAGAMLTVHSSAMAQSGCEIIDGVRACPVDPDYSGGGSLEQDLRNERLENERAAEAYAAGNRARQARYAEIIAQAGAALDRGDFQEALRLLREQQKLKDGPVVRENIAKLKDFLAKKPARDKANAIRLEANAAHRRSDPRAALELYRKALKIDPEALNELGLKQVKDLDVRVSAANAVQRTLNSITQAMTAVRASGGLDFDATIVTANQPQSGCALSGNTQVVNACNIASGLSQGVDDAIAGVYGNAPPGVSDRVRKGFQAVMERDWKVAKAWFEDALNRDPGNANLKRLILLTDRPPPRSPAAASSSAAPRVLPASALQLPQEGDLKFFYDDMAAFFLDASNLPPTQSSVPSQTEVEAFFRDLRSGNAGSATTKAMRLYVAGMPAAEYARLGGLPEPAPGAAAAEFDYVYSPFEPPSALSGLGREDFVRAFVLRDLKGVKHDPEDKRRMDYYGWESLGKLMYEKAHGVALSPFQESLLNQALSRSDVGRPN